MTKRKKWLAIIIALCTILMLMSGCAVEEGNHESRDIDESSDVDERREIQESESYLVPPLVFLEKHELKADSNRTFFQIILYDPETLIMYSYVEWIDGGGFVEMHNPDGSPRLYQK